MSLTGIINDLGKNRYTVILLSNYAHFTAFYLHDLIRAQNLLEYAMSISGINEYDLAECKMEYADVLLLKGDIWQSLLYYSQVEKDFKELNLTVQRYKVSPFVKVYNIPCSP